VKKEFGVCLRAGVAGPALSVPARALLRAAIGKSKAEKIIGDIFKQI
jgi:hypothetical protein